MHFRIAISACASECLVNPIQNCQKSSVHVLLKLISFDDPMSTFPDDHQGDNHNHDHDHYGQQPRQRESR